jgi:hypothetical protein
MINSCRKDFLQVVDLRVATLYRLIKIKLWPAKTAETTAAAESAANRPTLLPELGVA